jgi:energy-coupling factor transporter ATP-binding protein EcfA2
MATRRRDQRSQEMGSGSSAAYLLDLSIRNVRCFGPEEQTLRLSDAQGGPAPWTVILGDNGVGKTTLLQCLVALEPRRHLTSLIGEVSVIFADLPVHLPTGSSENWRIYRDWSQPEITTIQGRVTLEGGLRSSNAPSDTAQIVVPTSSDRSFRSFASPDKRLLGLRCFAYGATRQMGSAALNRRTEDPAASLFRDDVTLVDAEEWLLVEDYARSRGGSEESDRRLERVKRVLLDLLPDAEDLRIVFLSSKPVIEVKTPYGWVSLSDLSLGYRTMIAWTVDLASRMFDLYPRSPNPLAEPAVVLIDEVDLHLHPKWQRELRSHLTERFPNVQFVVTAHSPLVVQASENENIVVLRREGDHVVIDNDVETVRGWRVDQVLTSDLFGLETARPPEYDALIHDRNRLLSKDTLDERDRARLGQLESRISKLPAGETPEDLEAMEIIREAATRLRNS